MKLHFLIRFCAATLALLLWATAASAEDSKELVWRAKENRVDAEIKSWDLPTLLQKISTATGWEVYLEPGTTYTVSAKFKDLPADEALRRLLGKVNYARSPQTNLVAKLFVFRTVPGAATQLIRAEKNTSKDKKYLIPNELIVRLKPDSKVSIDELAKLLGAKIVGRDDLLKIYRLQFDSEAAANAARALLAGNSEVASVDSNYRVDRPAPYETLSQSSAGSLINPPPPSEDGPVVGLIDTALQPENCLDQFSLPGIAIAGNANPSPNSPTHGTGMYEALVQSMASSPGRVRPVDVYGNNPNTSTFEVAEGIIKAINSGANPINLSLGGTGDSEFLHHLIQEGFRKGILFVAAAGNEPGTALTFPAAYPEVLAVTAINSSGQIEPYANTGNFVDMAASGTATVCLSGQYWTMTGTSVSTANASGQIVALMNQKHITAQQAANQLVASQKK